MYPGDMSSLTSLFKLNQQDGRSGPGTPRPRAGDAGCALAMPCSASAPRRSPTGSSRPSSGSAASGAPSALLEGARRLHDRRRLRGRLHAATRPTRRSAAGHRPHRGRAGRLRPAADLLRGAAARLLGGPRPHPGHAPGQRPRHAVPLGDLLARRGPAAAAERSREVYGASWPSRLRRDHTEIAEAGPFYYAEDYHQQYLPRTPRLLRPRRDRRRLSDRGGRHRGLRAAVGGETRMTGSSARSSSPSGADVSGGGVGWVAGAVGRLGGRASGRALPSRRAKARAPA